MADEYKGLTIQFKGDTTGLRAALQQPGNRVPDHRSPAERQQGFEIRHAAGQARR